MEFKEIIKEEDELKEEKKLIIDLFDNLIQNLRYFESFFLNNNRLLKRKFLKTFYIHFSPASGILTTKNAFILINNLAGEKRQIYEELLKIYLHKFKSFFSKKFELENFLSYSFHELFQIKKNYFDLKKDDKNFYFLKKENFNFFYSFISDLKSEILISKKKKFLREIFSFVQKINSFFSFLELDKNGVERFEKKIKFFIIEILIKKKNLKNEIEEFREETAKIQSIIRYFYRNVI